MLLGSPLMQDRPALCMHKQRCRGQVDLAAEPVSLQRLPLLLMLQLKPVSQVPLLPVLQAAEGRTDKRRKGPTGAAIPAEDAGPPPEDAADARADAVEVTGARLLCACPAVWALTCCLGWSYSSVPPNCLCSRTSLGWSLHAAPGG